MTNDNQERPRMTKNNQEWPRMSKCRLTRFLDQEASNNLDEKKKSFKNSSYCLILNIFELIGS